MAFQWLAGGTNGTAFGRDIWAQQSGLSIHDTETTKGALDA
jgi:hypothetical protein